MLTTTQTKAQAAKLKEILDVMGHSLKHSQCLEAISKVEGFPDWNTHTAEISHHQQRAEDYLDEILESEREKSYAQFTQRWEQIYLVGYPEHRFLRHCRNDGEELGKYIRREFLGCAKPLKHPDGLYPGRVKYVWRAYYEKNEAMLTLTVYSKDGNYYVSGYGIEL